MTPYARLQTLLCFAMITATSFSSDAAEIRLRTECKCQSALIKLGDVAEVRDGDPARAQELSQIELFPAPGRTKTLRLRELEEMLSLSGIDVSTHSFAGSPAIAIHPAKTPAVAQANSMAKPIALSKAASQRARSLVEKAVANRLKGASEAKAPWEIKFELDDQQAQAVLVKGTELSVAGGQEPWIGRQDFVVTATAPGGMVRFEISAQISLPPMVVVATRPMRKGEVVRASDVELEPALGQVQAAIYRLEDVLGKETTRAVATGQVLDSGFIRSPILVQRGEVVRVIAKAAGVRVKSNGRAMTDGGHGDLIEVQMLEGKQRYTARVVNYQEVEVYAQGPSAKSEE